MPISGKSLYFHVPFCKKKCPYCHFYSIYPKNLKKELINKYLDSILKEIDRYSKETYENITSIYFGGGTPSLLEPNTISKILEKIKKNKKIKKNRKLKNNDIEVTLETNPEDVTLEKIKLFKKIGINRISMGVQSFNDEELKILKRSHSSYEAIKAINTIYDGGIENISIDLMYDLPYQTKKKFEQSIRIALSQPIKHVSLYNLTFEKNTPFYRNQKNLKRFLPTDELSLDLLKSAISMFSKNKFHRYEISAFSKNKKFESKHNIGYWIGQDYIGFGPSAFSYFFNKKRYKNVSNLNEYINHINNNKSPVDFEEKLPFPDNIKELLAINLRLIEGVDIISFQKKHGIFTSSSKITKSIEKLIYDGFLLKIEKKEKINKKDKNIIRLSEKGLLFYDYVAECII